MSDQGKPLEIPILPRTPQTAAATEAAIGMPAEWLWTMVGLSLETGELPEIVVRFTPTAEQVHALIRVACAKAVRGGT